MASPTGHLELLDDPVAERLLRAAIPARLAYTWHDGTPRVVPIWFHWNGSEIVVAGPPDAPKVEAIREHPQVALTVDDASAWPYTALLLRGTARVDEVEGIPPEYEACANRYFGEEQGEAWVETVEQMLSHMGRIRIRPEWVQIIDFQTRFPSKLASRMH